MTVGILSAVLGLLIGLCMDEFSRVSVRDHLDMNSHICAGTGETSSARPSIDEATLETGQAREIHQFVQQNQSAGQFFKAVLTESFFKPSVMVILLEVSGRELNSAR